MGEYIVGTDGNEGNWLTGERIIRCRDCEHYREVAYIDGKRMRCSGVFEFAECRPDGFCAWAKPKVITDEN